MRTCQRHCEVLSFQSKVQERSRPPTLSQNSITTFGKEGDLGKMKVEGSMEAVGGGVGTCGLLSDDMNMISESDRYACGDGHVIRVIVLLTRCLASMPALEARAEHRALAWLSLILR